MVHFTWRWPTFPLPLNNQIGIDDSQFLMVMLTAATIGLITPLIGCYLFVTCKIGNITLARTGKNFARTP